MLNVAVLHCPAPDQQAARAWPMRVLKADSIAHMDLTPTEKAGYTVSWVAHKLILLPTFELASYAFGVSQQLITQARKHQEPASLPAGMLAWGLLTATPDERTAVFAKYESLIWAALD